MGLEIVMLREVRQPHKDKNPLFSFLRRTGVGAMKVNGRLCWVGMETKQEDKNG